MEGQMSQRDSNPRAAELEIEVDQDIAKHQTVQIESQQLLEQEDDPLNILVRQKVQNFDKDGKPAEEMAENCDLLEEFAEEDQVEEVKTQIMAAIKDNLKKR